jgi:hypothetical protein
VRLALKKSFDPIYGITCKNTRLKRSSVKEGQIYIMIRLLTKWTLAFYLFGSVLCAQNSHSSPTPSPTKTPDANPTGAAQVQAPPMGVQFKKLVAFLKIDCRNGVLPVTIRGTAFFIYLEDKRLGENRGFVYLVTNRHMAAPEEDGHKFTVDRVSLRLNLKAAVNGQESEEGDIPLGPQFHWYFPEDEAVDLAVMPFSPDQNRYDYMSVPVSLFAIKDVVESQHIAEGDPVLFAGFFAQFPGQKRIEPIVRQGIVAMMPDEEIETTLRRQGRLYLADVHVFHGNSGSPMFVNVGGIRGSNLSVVSYRLLGIVSGYVYETQDFKLEIANTLTGTVAANSGIATVVPVDELKKLLDSPVLQAIRDSAITTK